MQALLPRPDIASKLQAGFVALAADADDPDPEVHDLCFELRHASMLPFVLFADAEGKFLAGSSGAQTPEKLLALLEEAGG